jgi:hypothetical protein
LAECGPGTFQRADSRAELDCAALLRCVFEGLEGGSIVASVAEWLILAPGRDDKIERDPLARNNHHTGHNVQKKRIRKDLGTTPAARAVEVLLALLQLLEYGHLSAANELFGVGQSPRIQGVEKRMIDSRACSIGRWKSKK